MILVDTTVWIDFFADRSTHQVFSLIEAIQQHKNIAICGVILTEILQGISDPKEYKKTSIALKPLIFLPTQQETYILAANIYRCLRTQGITIRKTIDCIIAAIALENNASLLHNDRDFEPIEKHLGLKTIF